MCNCTVENIFADSNRCYREISLATNNAKRIRKCGECGREIPIGEKYEIFIGVDNEGEKHVHETCLDCLSLRKSVFSGWVYNRLWEYFEYEVENTDKNFAECLSELTPRARQMAAEIIEKHWSE